MLTKNQNTAWGGLLRQLRRWKYRLGMCWYEFRCKHWNKYNIVTCKTLPPTWCDRDTLLLHSMFAVLCDFMENENPHTHWDWNYCEERKLEWQELNRLYIWWTAIRPVRKLPEYKEDENQSIEERLDSMFKPIYNADKTEILFYEYCSYRSPEDKVIMEQRHDLEEKWDKEDKEMMHRLINISDNLWT